MGEPISLSDALAHLRSYNRAHTHTTDDSSPNDANWDQTKWHFLEAAYQYILDVAKQQLKGFPSVADDPPSLAHDVQLRLFKALDNAEVVQRLEDEESVRRWIRRRSKYVCLDDVRRPPLPNQLGSNAEPPSPPGTTPTQYETREMFFEAVERLPEPERSAFSAIHFDQRKYQEVADELHLSYDQCHRKVTKAIRLLIQDLGEDAIRSLGLI